MTACVTRLYRGGRQLPVTGKPRSVRGDLNVSVSKHPVTGAVNHEAVILSTEAPYLPLLPSLSDVVLVSLAADGFRLRGIERTGARVAREYAQEWWCVPEVRA